MSEKKLYLIGYRECDYRCQGNSFVEDYVSGSKYHKIGIAEEPEQRKMSLSTGTPHKLKLISTINSNAPCLVENRLHSMFSREKLNGEWFRLFRNDINSFKALDRVEPEILDAVKSMWHHGSRFERSLYIDYKRVEKNTVAGEGCGFNDNTNGEVQKT